MCSAVLVIAFPAVYLEMVPNISQTLTQKVADNSISTSAGPFSISIPAQGCTCPVGLVLVWLCAKYTRLCLGTNGQKCDVL